MLLRLYAHTEDVECTRHPPPFDTIATHDHVSTDERLCAYIENSGHDVRDHCCVHTRPSSLRTRSIGRVREKGCVLNCSTQV